MGQHDAAFLALGIGQPELAVLVAAIAHFNVHQRPVARHRELLKFVERASGIMHSTTSGATTRLIKKGLLDVVGRGAVFGGEHLLVHTQRAERLLGLQQQCAEARNKFMLQIREAALREVA